mmetsp:Transcript_10477/g.18312  ORF Transcript_10477/g.18312 Transcript_10477/m.18312 type:complete len:143 (+) Transcript_10477:120-548(+)|eukprot:CAMPEP_0119103118 /NCGR_PEP_ID=MMETSP1180-20130426/1654_1 /TAXON_ID=3052 ORGANISM="Chlamydomonas cf sp, Strain CCMP681" /NCGR_SAMPLE_ID=MMETSP1180 /ASSEMBLY_ACC=CAM_ASM_000741 /LENGTH=142 /DNA_ID=CAMNT_0007087559 /DNA_START=120 /DNA_END=548 /DNA_ORIENTATION=-
MAKSEREVVSEYNSRRQRLQEVSRKIDELTSEVSEHDLVVNTLKPMDAGRRCFRLIGEVLVERTVGETLPAVMKNKANLEGLLATLSESMAELEKQLLDFQVKNKIKLVDKRTGQPINVQQPEPAPAAAAAGPSKGGQGVLV